MAGYESLSTVEDFEQSYKAYYGMLCMIAYEYVRDDMQAEEMVGNMFLALWEKRSRRFQRAPRRGRNCLGNGRMEGRV